MTTTAARCPRPVVAFAGVLAALSLSASAAGAAPEGEMRWGIHISLAPTYFDPAETPELITPFMVLYGSYPNIDGLFQEQASEPDPSGGRPRYTGSSSSCTTRRCTPPG